MTVSERATYFLSSFVKCLLRTNFSCPSCGSKESSIVDRKFLITSLRRCHGCKLLFRSPTTDTQTSNEYYQTEYQEGVTTELPSQNDLARLLSSNFVGHEKSFATYIDLLRILGGKMGSRVFDYGCSWGYGSWQLKQAGFEVKSFEISKRRAKFAREHLGVDIVDDPENLPKDLDFFFSSHVIEHVPSVRNMIDLGLKTLRLGGIFIAACPNGADDFRSKNPQAWHNSWGAKHPNLLDAEYYKYTFRDQPYCIGSFEKSLDGIRSWAETKSTQRVLELSGSGLLCVAVNNGKGLAH